MSADNIIDVEVVDAAKATLEKAAAENRRLGQEEINEVLQRRHLGIVGVPYYTTDGRTAVEIHIVTPQE